MRDLRHWWNWLGPAAVVGCTAVLIYFLVATAIEKRIDGLSFAIAAAFGIAIVIASLVSSHGETTWREWLGSLFRPERLAGLLLAIVGGYGFASGLLPQFERPAPDVRTKIAGIWGEPGCKVTYRFRVDRDALRVASVRRPPATDPFALAASIAVAKDDMMTVVGTRPERARGVAATFTYAFDGAVERLRWDDRTRPVPMDLDRCG